MTSEEIALALIDIWDKHCEEGDYVFLSRKNTKTEDWKDKSFKFSSSTEELKTQVSQWINTNSPERFNLYFCPLPFKGPRRVRENLRGSRFLWSDMDEVKVGDIDYPPSIYWESSPGRFQGLWEVDRFMGPEEAELLNRELTYNIGADKGGWDLTQVLRVPGTFNHKYPNKPKVGSFIKTKKRYRVKDLEYKLLGSKVEEEPEEEYDLDSNHIITKYKKVIPKDVISLLRTKRVDVGKRSDIIWYMEHELHKVGLSPPEIISLIKNSAWNKYVGRADEDIRLSEELAKIIRSKVEESGQPPPKEVEGLSLRVDTFNDMMTNLKSFPGWLVEGFWMRRSHGIVAGEPKSFKSVLTLDLAISVASGEPFLGLFPVNETGPVLIVQNENSDWIMKDRIEKILHSKGLVGKVKLKGRRMKIDFAPELPLYFINQQGFLLGDPVHQEILEKAVQEYNPLLVIFDPLYLMFEGDVNSAKDLNPVLNWMLKVKNDYNTGVIVIHHWNKGRKMGPSRGGQRMLGSTTLHGWVESAWYIGVQGGRSEAGGEEDESVTKTAGQPVSIVMEREFRAGGTRPRIDATIKMGELGDPLYEVGIKKHVGRGSPAYNEELKREIIDVLELRVGVVSQRQLSEDTGKGRRAIKKALDDLVDEDKINVTKKGIELIGEVEDGETIKDKDKD